MKFALEHFEIDGDQVPCVTRDDGRFETLQLVSAVMDLSRDDEEAYLTVCNLIFMLRDRTKTLDDGIEA